MAEVILRLPKLHEHQKIFGYWNELHPKAQVLIAPCGTKLGKSFGSAWWLTKELWLNAGLYGAWIGPTYLKCKIGYRYVKAMLPQAPGVECVDSRLEIRFPNNSFLKFLHGRDAETTVEGEAIDAFAIDEAGKQKKQLWFSLFTTLTQTLGRGIITGTPRGFTWYYDEFRKAKLGDPFYCWAQLPTSSSPFVLAKAIAQAKRLLPPHLFQQYYEALFVTHSAVFGNIADMFNRDLKCNPTAKFWIHPDAELRKQDTVTGWDIAKHRDYSVFYTVTTTGKLVGYARFRRVPYEMQTERLKVYLEKFFKESDKMVRYDATGIGDAVGEMISNKDIDASFTPVIFSNKSKQEMVARTSLAIESKWHEAPAIEQIEHEFGSYELNVTKSGLFKYSAPDGEHDDVVSAALLGISGAFQAAMSEEADKAMDDALDELDNEKDLDDEDAELEHVAGFVSGDEFFDDENADEDGDDEDADDSPDDDFDDFDSEVA